tara:strand:- start:3122 stop:3259 length:138 start_codon:yes stop_codon:yes gene_type:complete
MLNKTIGLNIIKRDVYSWHKERRKKTMKICSKFSSLLFSDVNNND